MNIGFQHLPYRTGQLVRVAIDKSTYAGFHDRLIDAGRPKAVNESGEVRLVPLYALQQSVRYLERRCIRRRRLQFIDSQRTSP